MNYLALMTGVDIPIPEFATAIHQPTIKEISLMGETTYFGTLQLICFNKNVLLSQMGQGSSLLANMSDFQLFMMLVEDKSMGDSGNRKNNLISLFLLFFPTFTVSFIPHGIYFNDATTQNHFVIDDNTFPILRDYLMEVGGVNSTTAGSNGNYNPKGKKAADIAAKLMRGRSKAAKSKGEGGGGNSGILARYVSILTVGLESMSLDKCCNLTVYQLYDLMERYGLYLGWDIDLRSRLAGGQPDDKPEDWMKSLH